MGAIKAAKDLFDLSGEVALVTGASSGLGARFVEVLAANGAKVALAARRTDRIQALATKLPNSVAITLDVTKAESFADAFDEVESTIGPVSLLINTAGVGGDESDFIDTGAAAWRHVQDTNVDAVWYLSQFFAKRRVAAKAPGTIINIASAAAFQVGATSANYAISKAAVVQMTKALALELAKFDIRVNGIAPGYIASEMTRDYFASAAGQAMVQHIPLKRVGDASDLDGLLLLLASKRASGWMTGTTVLVDGGHLLSFC